jgi:hypothetical protein
MSLNAARRKRNLRITILTIAGLSFVAVGSALTGLKNTNTDLPLPSGATADLMQQLQFLNSSGESTPYIPPLNSGVTWSRFDPTSSGTASNNILSLVEECTQTNSYSSPLFINLNGTNSSSATATTSNESGIAVFSYNRGTGSPWLAGMHSEVHHGWDGVTNSQVNSHGTSILYNGEMTTTSPYGTEIGLNLQNTASSTYSGTHAVQIQGNWTNGIHFDSGASGNIGINFDTASFAMGMDLGSNSLRMNAGQKIILETYGTIYLWYNPSSSKVELVKGGSVVASW